MWRSPVVLPGPATAMALDTSDLDVSGSLTCQSDDSGCVKSSFGRGRVAHQGGMTERSVAARATVPDARRDADAPPPCLVRCRGSRLSLNDAPEITTASRSGGG